MRAIGKFIIIRKIDREIKSEAGFILSGQDAEKLRYKIGEVVEPGTDVSVIKKGDEIYYDSSNSVEMLIRDEKFVVISERDVVVVVS